MVNRIIMPTALSLALASFPMLSSRIGELPESLQSESESSYQEVHQFWDEHGVTKDVQDSLVEKLEDGFLHDADLGTVDPVKTRFAIRGNFSQEILVFPDGSISVTGNQIGNESVKGKSPLIASPKATSIGGSQVTSGSGYSNYRNCTVFGSTATVQAFFVANYRIVQGSYNDSITWHGAPGQQCAGAICETPYCTHGNSRESSARPASASYFFQCSAGRLVPATGQISLEVGNYRTRVHFQSKVG